jgi:predicted SprT family Zn-dependent metalloprotease
MTPTEARQITLRMLAENGLTGWTLRFGTARTQAGLCSYAKRQITLSKVLMAAGHYDSTMDTIAHEVAHAIVGSKHGHDRVWQMKHRELGGNGKRCLEATEIVNHDLLQGAYEGTCPRCARKIYMHRMPTKVKSCGVCSHKFDPELVFTWIKNGVPVTVVNKPRKPRARRYYY